MVYLFILLFLASVPAFLIGMIWPGKYEQIFKQPLTRGKIALATMGLFFGSFIGVGLTAPPVVEVGSPKTDEVVVPEGEHKELVEPVVLIEDRSPVTVITATPPPAPSAPAPQPIAPPRPSAPSPATIPSCSCPVTDLDCGDFSTHNQAQAVYNCCMSTMGYDVHGLDGKDNDGLACESRP